MYATLSRKNPVSTQSVCSLSDSLKHLVLNKLFCFFLKRLLSLTTLHCIKSKHFWYMHTSTKSIPTLTSISVLSHTLCRQHILSTALTSYMHIPHVPRLPPGNYIYLCGILGIVASNNKKYQLESVHNNDAKLTIYTYVSWNSLPIYSPLLSEQILLTTVFF